MIVGVFERFNLLDCNAAHHPVQCDDGGLCDLVRVCVFPGLCRCERVYTSYTYTDSHCLIGDYVYGRILYFVRPVLSVLKCSDVA